MSYRFRANEDLSTGLRLVNDDQVGKALAELRDEDAGRPALARLDDPDAAEGDAA